MAALQQSAVALSYFNSPAGAASPSSYSSAGPSLALRSLSLRSVSSISGLPSLRFGRPSLRLGAAGRRRRQGRVMMMDTTAGSYAAALAEVAKSNNAIDRASQQIVNVTGALTPQAMEFFTDPTVEIEDKKKAVDEIAEGMGLEPYITNFLKIILEGKRMDLFGDIAKEFEVCCNKITGTELAVITSVVPMDTTHLAQIAKSVQRLTGAKNVRLKTVIDPSLVAGFTIRYGPSASKFIDMSVRKQLDEIARQLEFSVELVPS